MNEEKCTHLKTVANEIRKSIVSMLKEAKSGHPGGSLSSADLLTVLYFEKMMIDPENPQDENRDRFVLSKGHAAPVLYATLAERGFFDKQELLGLRKTGHMLQGHPDMRKVPGVDMSTGSLGLGFSSAFGMALSGKMDKKDWVVYALLGDGELAEGQVWESMMAASHYKLDNLIAFIDKNGLQIDGACKEVMDTSPLDDKCRAFGFDTVVIDGHDLVAISEAIEQAKVNKNGKPKMIILNTIKGKGVSFMENQAGWHGKAPNDKEAEQALMELGGE